MHNHNAPLTMPDVDSLIALLDKQYSYYEAIHAISLEESDKFQRQRPFSEIGALLRKKKILVACIEEIDTTLVPIKEQWSKHSNRSDASSRRAQQRIEDLDKLLKEILTIDKKNQRMLKAQLNVLQQQKRVLQTQAKG